MYLLLTRLPFGTRSNRALLAAALALLIFFISLMAEVTDKPGWYYVNRRFTGIIAVVLLGYWAGVSAAGRSQGTTSGSGNAA